MAQRRIGIKDVAEAAGVSLTTVSHALNGKGRLPDGTRERVQRLARELGYRPSATARNLVDGRTGLLGLVMPASGGLPFPAADVAYFMQLAAAATRVAMEHGYALVVTPGSGDGASPLARVEVDGAIVIDPVERDLVVGELRAAGLPVVTTGRVLGADGAWVDNDHARATRGVLAHLSGQGARRVALVTSQPATSFAADVEDAYRRWCVESARAPLVVRAAGDVSETAAEDAATAVLNAHPDVDAVFATLDRLALATLREAQARRVRVPEELLIVGATDSDAARWAQPPMTVLDLHPDEIGSRAARMLVELVGGRPLATPNVTVDAELVPRASTRRWATAAPAR